MITYRSLKKTLTALLKNKFPDCKVHFDNVEKSDAPYFYVEMQPYTSTVDGEGVYHDRNIEIDIQYIPDEDLFGRIERMKIYDIGQILDLAIRPVFYVEDRAITIPEAETTVHDEVLHYIFRLQFTDADMSQEEFELMEELTLNLRKE